MRILIDAICPGCGDVHPDVFVDNRTLTYPDCPACRVALVRNRHFAKANEARSDSIRGGVLIEHGLCDPVTAEPRRYYSRSEMAREAKTRGLVNWVEHKPDTPGSDKSRQTQRFV